MVRSQNRPFAIRANGFQRLQSVTLRAVEATRAIELALSRDHQPADGFFELDAQYIAAVRLYAQGDKNLARKTLERIATNVRSTGLKYDPNVRGFGPHAPKNYEENALGREKAKLREDHSASNVYFAVRTLYLNAYSARH